MSACCLIPDTLMLYVHTNPFYVYTSLTDTLKITLYTRKSPFQIIRAYPQLIIQNDSDLT